MTLYPLDRLGAGRFEAMAQALIKTVIGPGTTTFGAGRDGAREATFSGAAPYPSVDESWSGSWIIQVKYHDVTLVGHSKARQAIISDMINELNKIVDVYKHSCDNFILITNVSLSGVFETGTIDRIEREVRPRFHDIIPNIHVWGAEEVSRYLDLSPEVRRSYNELLVPGDVIAELLTRAESEQTDLARIIRSYLVISQAREQYAQLDQAGDVAETQVRLEDVFFDLNFTPISGVSNLRGDVLEKLLTWNEQSSVQLAPAVRSLVTDEFPRVTLIGGPGEGKSTVGQFIAHLHRATLMRELPAHYIDEGYAPRVPRIPFKIVLRELAQYLAIHRTDGTLEDYLQDHIKSVSGHDLTRDELLTILTANCTIFILDGLDEVADPELRNHTMQRIEEFFLRATKKTLQMSGSDLDWVGEAC